MARARPSAPGPRSFSHGPPGGACGVQRAKLAGPTGDGFLPARTHDGAALPSPPPAPDPPAEPPMYMTPKGPRLHRLLVPLSLY